MKKYIKIKNKKRFIKFLLFCTLSIVTVILLYNIFFSYKINLNGERYVKILVNEQYIDKGATAKHFFKNLTDELNIISNVDVTKVGNYEINYILQNKDGKIIKKKIRNVEVFDNINPEISLIGDKNITIYKGFDYVEQGVNITDNSNENLDNNLQIYTNLDTSTVGNYEIVYTVYDNSNNKSTISRNVSVIELNNTLQDVLPVLMYHFFYDKSAGEVGVDNNYIEINDFEEQIKYLKENNYYIPTPNELEKYIDGTLNLPEKSVVITVDDGSATFFKYALPILNKYNIKAISFVITSWTNKDTLLNYMKNNNVLFGSHSHDMHSAGNDQKGRIMTMTKSEIIDDLEVSNSTIGGTNMFCYPFGHFNNTAKEALKEANYKLAFTTKYGRIYPGMDKLELPRIRMLKTDTLSSFISKVS